MKQAVIGRIPLVSPEDATRRIDAVVGGLCSKEIDVSALADDFKVDIGGKDVPRTCSVAPLYKKVNSAELGDGSAYTFCLGMLPSEKDPAVPFVRAHWRVGNFPEKIKKIGRLVPEDICDENAHSEVLATCSCKFHVIIPSEGKPFLLIYPTQYIEPDFFDARDGLERIRDASEDKGTIRDVENRLRGLRSGGSPFRHRDRDLVMVLLGLEAARALGITDIALPAKEIFERPEELDSAAWGRDGRLKDLRLIRRYDDLEETLKGTPDFRIFRWSGK